MATRTVNIQLVIETDPAFTGAQLLDDLSRQVRSLAEPEPQRKPGRSAWHVKHSAVVFANVGETLQAEQEMCGCHTPARPMADHAGS